MRHNELRDFDKKQTKYLAYEGKMSATDVRMVDWSDNHTESLTSNAVPAFALTNFQISILSGFTAFNYTY